MENDDESPAGAGEAPRPLRLGVPVRPLRLSTPARRPGGAGAPVDPPAPPARWTGEALRQAREARGLTIRQLAERTKVTPIHIANVEADQYGQLPPAVYLRGILLALSKELRLDGPRVSRSYLDAMREAVGR